MKKLSIPFCVILFSISSISFAQNSISVSSRGPIYKDIIPESNAGGHAKMTITDDSQWLNYTTLVEHGEPALSITVEVTSGSIPEGMELQIEASPYKGISRGKMGHPTQIITVSDRPQVLIDHIKTCYTGSSWGEGHQLTFSFIITDYAKVKAETHTIYVQYTITQ